MQPENDAMMVVRAELSRRLALLQRMVKTLSEREFAENVEGLRRLAAVYGLTPVVRVAEALERAVAEDRRACPRALYLSRLQDAIDCDRSGESAAEAMLASVSVRLCG